MLVSGEKNDDEGNFGTGTYVAFVNGRSCRSAISTWVCLCASVEPKGAPAHSAAHARRSGRVLDDRLGLVGAHGVSRAEGGVGVHRLVLG